MEIIYNNALKNLSIGNEYDDQLNKKNYAI